MEFTFRKFAEENLAPDYQAKLDALIKQADDNFPPLVDDANYSDDSERQIFILGFLMGYFTERVMMDG